MKKTTPQSIISKLLKTNNKQKILKSARGERRHIQRNKDKDEQQHKQKDDGVRNRENGKNSLEFYIQQKHLSK